jgi:hypothetical protein
LLLLAASPSYFLYVLDQHHFTQNENKRRIRWTQFSSCCSLLSVHLVNELIEKYASSLLHDLKWNQIENKTQNTR